MYAIAHAGALGYITVCVSLKYVDAAHRKEIVLNATLQGTEMPQAR